MDIELKTQRTKDLLVSPSTRPPQPQPSSIQAPSQVQCERIKQMEGECRVLEFTLLRVNYLKGVFLLLLLTISVVGLLLLKYYKKLRAMCFYDELTQEEMEQATHVYVKGSDKNEEISVLVDETYEGTDRRVFFFRYLKYEFIGSHPLPVALPQVDSIQHYLNSAYLSQGLTTQQAQIREKYYGRNQHLVEVPHYFEYLFDVMTTPFFIFQYVAAVIWILEGIALFGIGMIFFSAVTTSINYFLLYFSYKKIKQTAQKRYPVQVLREGRMQEIANVELVPGDLYIPPKEIPCDSIILKGELFVDEASLTGQNVPISKTMLAEKGQVLDSGHWVYEGSKLETMKEAALALAVHVGFGSRRGRIIRKILTKVPKQPQFFKKLIWFLCQVLMVSFILYGAFLYLLLERDIAEVMIVFRFLDFITFAFPAPFPIYFNLAYSCCLIRLNRDGIIGTESQKTLESSRMRTLCFDKTGTLTHNAMQVAQVHLINNATSREEVTEHFTSHNLPCDIFAACHSVEPIDNQLKGDEIDLRMFQFSGASLSASIAPKGVLREINVQDRTIQILKLNQYESQFQSMSVLYRIKEHNRHFIAVKGSPEKIHNYCQTKHHNFDNFVKGLSLAGYRSIAFGFKQLEPSQVSDYMLADRQEFLKGNTILGVVTFVNQLKSDAAETIDTLTSNGINTKIITGDNIFLGVKTAMMTNMIPDGSRVIILEGAKCTGQKVEVTQLQSNNGQIRESQYSIEGFSFQNQDNLVYAIDNAFLESREDFLHERVKVFARITPENKALIVRKHRERETKKVKNRSCGQKVLGEASLKVGMVGDGANDLIAIKEANVGIGISSSDAVYSASFAVQHLSQIITIILESKNIERQIVDMAQYFELINFFYMVSALLQSTDSSYFTSEQMIYRNFALTVLMTLFFGLSRPATRLTPHLPASNFMGLEHHLVFWGNALILSGGMAFGYFLFYKSSAFDSNPQPKVTFSSGWNGECDSATLVFLLGNMVYILMAPVFYRADPWKQPFYKNTLMFLLFILNLLIMVPMFFLTKYFGWMTLTEIPVRWGSIELSIIMGTCLVAAAYSLLIEKLRMHEKVDRHTEQENSKVYEIM